MTTWEPGEVDLGALDAAFCAAIARGAAGDLPVIGYGEISVAFAWPPVAPSLAVKSVGPFRSVQALQSFTELLDEYVTALGSKGLDVVPTAVRATTDGNRPRAYCIQPLLPAEELLSVRLRTAPAPEARLLLARVVEAVVAVVDRQVGLDCQVSNWAVGADGLRFFDVTTPMLRDGAGRDRLDTGVFIAALPWVTRWPVRTLLAARLLDPYHDVRSALLDLAGNLHRERLTHLVPTLLEVANPVLDTPFTQEGIRRFYRSNAALWSALQALRRADRTWQRTVRRRTYAYLIPQYTR